jgi:hypothetical protein
MLDAIVVPRAAGIPSRDAELIEPLGDPFCAPPGFQSFQDPNPYPDLLLVVRAEANVTVPPNEPLARRHLG